MIKKINILLLSFLFFLSTTGLPLAVHYCEMLEAASLEECEMHNTEFQQTSCCESSSPYNEKLSDIKDECCESFLVDKSVKENFISSKNQVSYEKISIINIDIFYPQFLQTEKHFSKVDTSPPPLDDNHLYLTNSILLI